MTPTQTLFTGPLRQLCAAALISTAASFLAPGAARSAEGEVMLAQATLDADRKIGAAEHPKAVQAFGGLYDNADLTRYIDSIGQLLVKTSEYPNETFVFVVLDSDIVNAFALPGGYVHVTRGLLALANNEAEAAGVIAHEIGHVTARHGAQREQAATWGGLAAALGGLLGGDIGAQIGQLGATYGLARYSQNQEYEADSLGIRYLRRAGFDPEAEADFLGHLQAYTELESRIGGRDTEGLDLFASHPRTPDRVRAAIKEAGGGPPVRDPIEAKDIYLKKIDGIVYGDSPDSGFIRGTRFAHPKLGFVFEVPQNFKLANQPDQVVASGPQGAGILFRQSGSNAAPLDYLRNAKVGGNTPLSDVQATTINGMQAASGTFRGKTDQGTIDGRVMAIRFDDKTSYEFIFLSPPQATASLNDAFMRTANSFNRISSQEAATLQPLRIQVVQVKAGDTVQSLAERTAFPDHKLERFLVLNGLSQGATLRPGELVKLVVEGKPVK
jgi:predicted Zn-dependent protease